jgi:Outer membrane protein beta-barrel domain
MKKLILTFAGTVLIVSCVMAQNFSGGIKVGLNLADQKISGSGIALDTKTMPAFHGGVFVTYMFAEKTGVQPELLYSMQGSKIDIDGFKIDSKFDYLNIPVLFRYNITQIINVNAGPQVGFLMSAKQKSDGTTEDVKSSFKSTDFSLAFGAGIDLPVGLIGGVRYSLGLAKIQDTNDPDFGSTDFKNNNLQIYLGYKLFGKKK